MVLMARLRYHLWSAGMTYQGAHGVLVRSKTAGKHALEGIDVIVAF